MVPFLLSAAEAGGGYIAALQLKQPFEADIELTGTRQTDGAVLFAGVRERNTMSPPIDYARVAALRVGTHAASGLSGTIEVERTYDGNRFTWTLQILSASREPLDLAPAGRWRGYAVQRSCTGHCAASTRGDAELSLTLWQTGTGVAGTLNESLGGGGSALPMTGTLAGAFVAMSGGSAPGTPLRRIETFELTMNALGRFSGRLTASVATTRYNAATRLVENVLFRVQSDVLYLAREW